MQFSLQVRLLGVVQISQNDQVVEGFESRKALALLCYLMSDPHPIPRSQLVDLFWADKSETRGKGNLSRVLNNINRLLPDCLEANRQTVRFVPPPSLWLDTNVFDQLYREKTIASWNAAANLYQGTFLQGIFLDDAPTFETWLISQQEHWQQRVAEVLNGLTAYYLQKDEFQRGLKTTDHLLKLNPWREEAHRLKMLFLALTGQRSEALHQYQECQKILEQELELNPSELTQSLCKSIEADGISELQGEWKTRLFQPQNLVFMNHNLPAATTPFFGRTQELSDLTESLTASENRLWTLVGLGGMGKTRLALETANQMISHFHDGVFFIPLDAVRSGEGFLAEISQVLKLFPARQESLQQQLLNLLRDKQMLLILDSFEHLIDETTLLLTLLKEAPQLCLMVTSRQRLKLTGEQVFEVHGLSVNSPEPGAFSTLAPAVEMFLESARRAGSALHQDDHATVQKICEKLDGMPLGLELAAPWTRTVSCATIAEEIDKNLGFLTDTTIQDTARHQSIQAAFEHSWQLLNDTEKTTFAKLSVFKGGFTSEALTEVTESSWTTLASLQDKSLVHRASSHRFSLHGLLRQFGMEQLEKQRDLKQDIQCRHCTYFMAFAQDKGQQLQGEGQFNALRAIGQELENILIAWDWALNQGLEDLLTQVLYPLSRFFELNSRFEEGKVWFDEASIALSKVELEDSSLFPQLMICRGTLFLRQGDYEQSQKFLEQGLSLLKAEDTLNRACALEALGETYYFKGNDEDSKSLLEEGLSLFESLDNVWGTANGKNNLGNLYWRQGDYQRAQQLHQEALTLRQQMGDDWGMASSLNNLGAVAYHMEDYPSAQHYFEQGLEVGKGIEDHHNVAACLNNLGEVARRLTQMDRAKQLHQDSLKLRQKIGDRIGIAYSFNNLGDTSLTLGELEEAFASFQNALQRAMEVQAFPAAIYIMVGIARCFAQQKNWKTCAHLVGFILNHSEKGNDVDVRVRQLLEQIEAEIPEATLQPWLKHWENQSTEQMAALIQQLSLN